LALISAIQIRDEIQKCPSTVRGRYKARIADADCAAYRRGAEPASLVLLRGVAGVW
jgi:hypothetical protein